MCYQELLLERPEALNAALYNRFLQLSGTDRVRCTHHFGGRFENIYIREQDIPEIAGVLALFRRQAGQRLGIAAQELRAGFWFNAMEAGQRTSLHHHDENDELLSGVYYIRVPERSGELILHEGGRQVRIRPQAGKLVTFSPALPHEVSVQRGSGLRLSVGMNVGPAHVQAGV